MRSWLALLLIVLFCFTPLMGQAEELPLLDFSAVKDRFVSNPRNVKDIGDPFVLASQNVFDSVNAAYADLSRNMSFCTLLEEAMLPNGPAK